MRQRTLNRILFFGLVIISGLLQLGILNPAIAKMQQDEVFEEFKDNYNPDHKSNCSTCESAKSCEQEESATAPPYLKYAFLFLLSIIGAIYLTKKFNWKIAALLLSLIALGFIPKKHACSDGENNLKTLPIAQTETPTKTEQDEFQPLEQGKGSDEFEDISKKEEFQEFSDDEFSELSSGTKSEKKEKSDAIWANRNFTLSILVLSLTLIAGILVRYKTTRRLKIFMLLGTMIFLGFINGGCPCMISSFQNVVLYIIGVAVAPVLMLWFLGLIVLTYFFGKVWCGWVCHLGALQEFIFRPGALNILHDRKSQRILRWVRIATLIILVTQIIVTRTNIFIHYDPFKVAFNLRSANTLGYVLVAIMLVSSLLIYRPFCRAICPIGLILGWVSYIPGAAKLSKNTSCIDCKTCSNRCKQHAMIHEDKKSSLNNEDCILCGDCIDSCKFNSLKIK